MVTKNVNVRLPDELHALVKASADADRRSLNSQIVWLLEAGLATRDEKRPNQTPGE
jgi:predicted HicB family RNase H-like nuclease